LRIVSPQSDIKLTELKVVTNLDGSENQEDVGRFINSLAIDKDIDRLYSFVISNTEFIVEATPDAKDPKQAPFDESDILAKPPTAVVEEEIDQPSKQMRPAR